MGQLLHSRCQRRRASGRIVPPELRPTMDRRSVVDCGSLRWSGTKGSTTEVAEANGGHGRVSNRFRAPPLRNVRGSVNSVVEHLGAPIESARGSSLTRLISAEEEPPRGGRHDWLYPLVAAELADVG